MLDKFDLMKYAEYDDASLELIDCLQRMKDAEDAENEKCEQTLIDPMWAWLDYEIDSKGPEGFWTGLDGNRSAVPFRVICETCGKRAGMHHGQDGLNCDVDTGFGRGPDGFYGSTDVRRFVPKRKP